jgi:hypothetical protein
MSIEVVEIRTDTTNVSFTSAQNGRRRLAPNR